MITNATGALGTITEEQWDRAFDTNAKGVLFSIQPALALMKRGGTIVIIGSTASIKPPPSMSEAGSRADLVDKAIAHPHGIAKQAVGAVLAQQRGLTCSA